MIKCLIWDLDGVLVKTSKIHFDALNQALANINPEYCVSESEDLQFLGTKTSRDKVKIISQIKGLPEDLHSKVLDLKKQFTLKLINSLNVNEYFNKKILLLINKLKSDGYKIFLASNTNKEFIDIILEKTNLSFDNIYCSADVRNTKPNPEIYLKSFIQAGLSPDECVIFEDSFTGQEAAIKSGAYLYPVESPNDLQYEAIINYINKINKRTVKWHSKRMNVVIPMAGEGSRFKQAGWITPKPLIDVRGLPMVAAVIRDLKIDAQFTFIIKEEHDREYHLTPMLKLIEPYCNIVCVSGKQSGAATTVLQAKHIFDNNDHLMVVNSDQMWDWQANVFYQSVSQAQIDGSIVVFEDETRSPKWSYAKTDENGYVVEVAEKKPISNLATAGIYYLTKGSDFVKYANQMIEANDKVNNEFYVCPIYSYLIKDNKKITTFKIKKFWPTGTPEELEYYLTNRSQ